MIQDDFADDPYKYSPNELAELEITNFLKYQEIIDLIDNDEKEIGFIRTVKDYD